MVIGKAQAPYRCFTKSVFRWSPSDRLFRVGRIVWARGDGPGKTGGGYSAKLSLALAPVLIGWKKEWRSIAVTVLGIRVHYMRSYGGWLT